MKNFQWTTPCDYPTASVTGLTREHWEEVMVSLLEGILAYASPGKARIKLPGVNSTNGLVADELEGFSRSLIMAAPLLKSHPTLKLTVGNQTLDVVDFYHKGILAGTNPQHPEYWGQIGDFSQNIVECGSLAWSLYLSQAQIWDKYSDREKQQVADYLLQCNRVKGHANNWLLFKVIINTVLERLGMSFSKKEIFTNLEICKKMYLGEGWYRDGKTKQIDYYNAWGFHYYFLMWVILDGDRHPEIAQLHLQRMREYMHSFRYFFSGEGNVPCFGRSVTYRFAYLAPIALGLYLDGLEQDLGELKSICNRSLQFFLNGEVLTEDNLLTPGYLRYSPRLLEFYSCAASPYWLGKAFNLLLLPESHPFWQAEEKPLAIDRDSFSISIESAGYLLVGDRASGHVQLLNHKSHHSYPELSSKYTNFAYSSLFGYDIGPIRKKYDSDSSLCDNALTFSDGGRYVQRSQIQPLYCKPNFIASKYPLRMVKREATNWLPRIYTNLGWAWTYTLVKDDFMINVHYIKTRKSLKFKEGGYPLGFDEGVPEIISTEGAEVAYKDGKISFIRNLYGYDRQFPAQALISKDIENNIRYKSSVVPALGFENQNQKSFYLANMVYGKIGHESIDRLMQLVHNFQIADDLINLHFYDGEQVVMQLDKIKRLNLTLNGKTIQGKIAMARVSEDGKTCQIVQH
ncbi:MAG: DUF2264 domain-containing protein [Roseofilum sp. SBFL]|uniref:DUF2264 domain-containing protein n=1 Tax=unclassified Roseofilum TaxID=2620099 RepID=UPI001B010248|nr:MULTISPECIES: DUF2264 domain-containing protein [unclassified Roseofilum]MBP0011869.1 DUF2264 domain-containing protein [Roseofilum sp. SID3]MBP0025489.1 DUF2264 domain-containing protein [Roseofilum sp. SID2]MBP0037331.1 DUF2264 domain-containing protein [Roseofilum sp. SID1]MBP0041583.1 DUF2264 domain-containing protein [Roseofilum sp. SBFL]